MSTLKPGEQIVKGQVPVFFGEDSNFFCGRNMFHFSEKLKAILVMLADQLISFRFLRNQKLLVTLKILAVLTLVSGVTVYLFSVCVFIYCL